MFVPINKVQELKKFPPISTHSHCLLT